MKKALLGKFKTDGNILATDPCYEKRSSSAERLKVKPGTYKAYAVYGQLKKPFVQWDTVKGNYRSAELLIIHECHVGKLNFELLDENLGVDSGQFGFFNLKTFGKQAKKAVSLHGQMFDFLKQEISRATMLIRCYRKKIKDNDFNKAYSSIKELEEQIKYEKKDLAESRKFLKTKTFPHYLKPTESADFYEIICDLSLGEHEGGCNDYGAVSKSGIGDGAYPLYVHRNKKGEITACCVKFLPLNKLK